MFLLCMLSHSVMSDSATQWTVACQTPLSMGFFRQEYWSEFPCPPPGDLPDSEIEPMSPVAPALPVDSLPLSHQGSPYKLGGGRKDANIQTFVLTPCLTWQWL